MDPQRTAPPDHPWLGPPIDLTRLKSRTANAFLVLAALVMAGPERPLERTDVSDRSE
ncbi:hypothetical protein [Streptomyces cyaneus]|uniref:hypothetical protein n=1 Tax=Streptomyces cyaneus TaxID=1904 RepID=UPI0013E3A1BB|nr:hypothetical protein [Streptomyces cyaneus]